MTDSVTRFIEASVDQAARSFESLHQKLVTFTGDPGELGHLAPEQYLVSDWSEPVTETTYIRGWLWKDTPKWMCLDKNSLLSRLTPHFWPFVGVANVLNLNDVWVGEPKVYEVTIEYRFATVTGATDFASGGTGGVYWLHLGDGQYCRITRLDFKKAHVG